MQYFLILCTLSSCPDILEEQFIVELAVAGDVIIYNWLDNATAEFFDFDVSIEVNFILF